MSKKAVRDFVASHRKQWQHLPMLEHRFGRYSVSSAAVLLSYAECILRNPEGVFAMHALDLIPRAKPFLRDPEGIEKMVNSTFRLCGVLPSFDDETPLDEHTQRGLLRRSLKECDTALEYYLCEGVRFYDLETIVTTVKAPPAFLKAVRAIHFSASETVLGGLLSAQMANVR